MARILVATSDSVVRSRVSGALRDVGHKVFVVGDSQECLSFLSSRPPDVLLLDPGLPRLQAVGLLRHVRRSPELATLRIVFLGGRVNHLFWQTVAEQLSEGVVDREKPMEILGGVAAALGEEPPAAPPAPPPGEADAVGEAPPAAAPAPRRQVLVVESVARVGLALGLGFDARGWNAVCLGTGAGALAAVEREQVHAILADLDLPDMPGVELARQVRREHPDLKMLLMTDLPPDRWPHTPKGVPILPKPISVDQLLQAMRFMKSDA